MYVCLICFCMYARYVCAECAYACSVVCVRFVARVCLILNECYGMRVSMRVTCVCM